MLRLPCAYLMGWEMGPAISSKFGLIRWAFALASMARVCQTHMQRLTLNFCASIRFFIATL